MGRHYLDHASTSPLRPEAAAAMIDWLGTAHGDPSRIHAEGLASRVAIEQAREHVATMLGARSREVVFTSGATESIVTAIWGAAERGGHMVVPAVEHSAVREAAAVHGGQVTVVGVDRTGRVDPDAVAAAIRPDTSLVNLQWVNHEVGTVQPVREVVQACRERGVLVHIDAAQAAGRLPLAFGELGADLVSVSAHKFGGPPGIGALLIRRGLRLRRLLVGGDQERARRAGFENVPAIVGFGATCARLTPARLEEEASIARRHTDRVLAAVAELDGVHVYGDPDQRAPHLVCLGIDGIEPQAVLLGLDRAGIAAHSGSACSSEALEPSPVLEAMGVDAHRSLRISVGWDTTNGDIEALLGALPEVITSLRALRA
ncbi:cysteine desulfurase family protein [Rhabdothermincola sediminis]|uniref:cysteine desulfurase family protein n=1 Tax=Rhabdothermincola sediminis TaxID=2751370 RepID=UPI001AA03420|nr:cysteine desulfurase family protein [Rhabdothermincola sediminis]